MADRRGPLRSDGSRPQDVALVNDGDPIIRLAAWQAEIKAALRSIQGMTQRRIMEATNKPPQWWPRMMRGPDADRFFRLSDAGPLDGVLQGAISGALARARGCRLVPVEAMTRTSANVLSAAAWAMREFSEAAGAAAAAIDGGISPSEAARIAAEIADARRALGEFEEAVRGAAVIPIRSQR